MVIYFVQNYVSQLLMIFSGHERVILFINFITGKNAR